MTSSENLSIKILSIQENGFELTDCSCILILGSTILTAKIPTIADIIINTTKTTDEEMCSLIIKQSGQNILKSFIPVGAVRRDRNYRVKLEPLGVKADMGSTFSLDIVFSLTRDGREVFSSSKKSDNPFQENLYRSETGFTTQDFYATFKSEDFQQRNEAEIERIINEVKLDKYGVIPVETQSIGHLSPGVTSPNTRMALSTHIERVEVRPSTEVHEIRNQADVQNLIEDLRSSMAILERDIEVGTVDIHQELEEAIIDPQYEEHNNNFAQSAPMYSAEDFNSRAKENNSPEFGHKEFNYTAPGDIKIYDVDNQQTVTLKVPDARGSYQINKWEGHDSYVEKQATNTLGSERRNSTQWIGTARSVIEDVKIEKNETYMLTMKNQLSSKHISFINDAFTREIILHMAKNKKKVSAVRLRRSLTIRDKEEVDIDKKEFFNTGCTSKFIHFFQPGSQNLFLFNLVQPFDHIDDTAKKVLLNIDFDISPHHKSAITPAGMIFIAGARADFMNPQEPKGTNSFHVLNYRNYTLVERPSMLCQSRQEFGFCYMSKNLFAIGGIVDGVISNKCERYDVRANKWIKIAPMTRPLREASVCSFNNRYLYRFFGIDSGNNIDHSIERYDAVRDTWTVMNVPTNEFVKEIYAPFCTQVNQDCIFLFGGKNINGFSPKTCKGWVLKVEDKRGSNNAELVESKNFVPGLAGSFSRDSVLTHAGDVIFLRESY